MSGVLLSLFVNSGCFMMSFGVFLPVMCAEFGWSRGLAAIGLTLGTLFFGLPSPLWGYLVARFGPRAILTLGNALAALGLAGVPVAVAGVDVSVPAGIRAPPASGGGRRGWVRLGSAGGRGAEIGHPDVHPES